MYRKFLNCCASAAWDFAILISRWLENLWSLRRAQPDRWDMYGCTDAATTPGLAMMKRLRVLSGTTICTRKESCGHGRRGWTKWRNRRGTFMWLRIIIIRAKAW